MQQVRDPLLSLAGVTAIVTGGSRVWGSPSRARLSATAVVASRDAEASVASDEGRFDEESSR